MNTQNSNSRAETAARNPANLGYKFIGYGILLANNKYVREWLILAPGGVLETDDLSKMAVYASRKVPDFLIKRLDGAYICQVFENPKERLVRWGDWPPYTPVELREETSIEAILRELGEE